MQLTKNEMLILKELKKIKSANDLLLMSLTGLNADAVRRSCYFLSEKNLVTIKENREIKYRLTELGKEVVNAYLPEELIANYEYVKDVPKDIVFVLNQMKEKGFIKIEGGKIIFLKDVKELPLLKFKELAKNKEEFSYNEIADFVEELLKRKYIKEDKKMFLDVEITENGLAYDIKENVIGKITRDVLEKKTWKNAIFREYVIKPEDVENAEIGKEQILNIFINRIKEIFLSMGFQEMKGNYVETSFWNFDALYQPQDHPSRDLADTFFLPFESNEEIDEELIKRVKEQHEKGWKKEWKIEEAMKCILRTHTTVLSARTLAKYKKGKFFAVGRVFRNEAIDYKHLAEFHQVEGIIADENVNFRHLLWILKEFFLRLGFDKIRFRPSYFPYTEPSLEIEVFFEKKNDWIEIGGAGMFRKEVTEPLQCVYPVLAFGLSLERPLMLITDIDDIRAFYTNDFDIYTKNHILLRQMKIKKAD